MTTAVTPTARAAAHHALRDPRRVNDLLGPAGGPDEARAKIIAASILISDAAVP